MVIAVNVDMVIVVADMVIAVSVAMVIAVVVAVIIAAVVDMDIAMSTKQSSWPSPSQKRYALYPTSRTMIASKLTDRYRRQTAPSYGKYTSTRVRTRLLLTNVLSKVSSTSEALPPTASRDT